MQIPASIGKLADSEAACLTLWATIELSPAAGPMRWHVPQTYALVHTLRVATRRQLGRAPDPHPLRYAFSLGEA
jgi:hypothetical protein